MFKQIQPINIFTRVLMASSKSLLFSPRGNLIHYYDLPKILISIYNEMAKLMPLVPKPHRPKGRLSADEVSKSKFITIHGNLNSEPLEKHNLL